MISKAILGAILGLGVGLGAWYEWDLWAIDWGCFIMNIPEDR
jgi:hypothetical protein